MNKKERKERIVRLANELAVIVLRHRDENNPARFHAFCIANGIDSPQDQTLRDAILRKTAALIALIGEATRKQTGLHERM